MPKSNSVAKFKFLEGIAEGLKSSSPKKKMMKKSVEDSKPSSKKRFKK